MTNTSFRGALAAAALIAVTIAGCTMKKQEAPDLTGPSEYGLSLTLSAVPDVLVQDGASQSVVTIQARGPSGQPAANVPLRAEIYVGFTPVDYGLLSARNVATDGNGRATVVYTAPPGVTPSVDEGTIVLIAITPIGSNFDNTVARFATIRLVPPGVILAPNGTPRPDFTIAPTSPNQGDEVIFDASITTDPDSDPITSYSWAFSNGATASGQVVSTRFTQSGPQSATLTVTDARGLSASKTKAFTVGASTRPNASFVFSPVPVVAGAPTFFNASTSTAAAGRSLVSFLWNFGDGTTSSGVTVTKTFAVAGSYTVTLTVTDDVDNSTTTSQVVTVVP